MNTLHFWPDDIVNDLPVSPLAILNEAAVELGQATKGAVEVEVKLDSNNSNQSEALYDFTLFSKAMGFCYELLYVAFNPVVFYPCTIVHNRERIEVQSEADFRQKLVETLRSPQAVSAVKAMLAQSQ